MTTVLALDTCFNACSATLWPGSGREPVVRFEPMERGHAERLVPMIGELFEEAGVSINSLSQIIVTTGPGSFTGARIGIAAARALALSTGAKLAPLSSLRLMAETAVARSPELTERPLAVAIDARRGEVYFELFGPHTLGASGQDASGPASSGPVLITPEMASAALPKGAAVLGSGAALVVAAAPESQGIDVIFSDLEGNARFAGEPQSLLDGASLRPLYLRPPDAKPQTAGALPRTSP